MAHDHETIDISDMPDVLRLAEEVHDSKSPRILRRDDEEIAIILPLANSKPKRGKRVKTQADYEAFLAAAGSWKDVDVEAFKAYIRERRAPFDRPLVDS